MRPLRIFISHPSHFLTDCEPHGDGLLAFEYIRRLGERGHELHVAVPVMCVRSVLPPTVHLHPIHSRTAVSTVQPSMQNRLEYSVRVRRLLRRLQRSVPFHLIHQLNPVVVGMSALLSGCRLPMVLGPLPAPGILPLPRTAFSRCRRALLHAQIRRAAMVLVPNLATLPLIPETHGNSSKVRLLPFGIDTEVFCPAQEAEPSELNVLFLANLIERKGAWLLLEAFERIASKYPDCKLRFAGSGVGEAALKARAARSAVADRIEFLGKVPRDRVAEVMQTATVYCLPSYYEAFGMTALEAMACGKPVIGTQVGGLSLLVEPTSPPVRVGDREGLAAALDHFLSSAERRAQASKENRRLAVEEYQWDRVIDRLETLYAELVPSS